MQLLTLTGQTAELLSCCRKLRADLYNEDLRRAFANSLHALGESRPPSPAILVGLVNQTIALGDAALFRIAQGVESPSPLATMATERAIDALRSCVADLHQSAEREGSSSSD